MDKDSVGITTNNKTMTPTFSIIIPHKEIPDLLMRCLRSIPVSGDIQVIVVDDNSADADDFFTDNLYDIITKYQNHQVDMILFKADSIESITMKPSNRHIKVNSAIDCCLKKN